MSFKASLSSDSLGRRGDPRGDAHRLLGRRDRLGDELGCGGARFLPVVLVGGEEVGGAEREAVGRLRGRLPLVPRAAGWFDAGGGDVGREEVLSRVLRLKTNNRT